MLPCQAGGDHASVSGGTVLPPAIDGKACYGPLTAYRKPLLRIPPCLPLNLFCTRSTPRVAPVSTYPEYLSGKAEYTSTRKSPRSPRSGILPGDVRARLRMSISRPNLPKMS